MIEPIFVRDRNDLMKLKQKQSFYYYCKRCGKQIINKTADLRTKNTFNGICTPCKNSIAKNKTKKEPILITNIDDVKSFTRHQTFYYYCKRCGRINFIKFFDRRRIDQYKKFLCSSCSRSESMMNNDNFAKNYNNYFYNGEYFRSSWELAIWIYANDSRIPISKNTISFNFYYEGEVRKYTPDFIYNGKLIDIVGKHHFLNENPNNRMIYPYRKCIFFEGYLDEEEKKYMDDLCEARHQCGLKNGVEFWCQKECLPYVEYVEKKYGKDYLINHRINK